jgi:alpha-amylase/alpha-mannosidase (GH57 family)
MEKNASDVYEAILEADLESQSTFSGHGSALAQAYNHIILPLANSGDKYTQVFWGIRDFEHRFGRSPEGMWLPETAVDLETLDVLAVLGMRFTILAPHQARQVRPMGEEKWHDVSGAHVDTTMPYVQNLPSGRSIVIFFYNGPISRAVAFEKLLNDGETFAQRLLSGFREDKSRPQIVHIATDGESYGHHHRFGDMALAYAVKYIEKNSHVRLTNYGEYLEKHPPTQEVEILENTSWSCVHGIERWQSDCGCNSGKHPEWNQAWRRPLRKAMNLARDHLTTRFEDEARTLLIDPRDARNGYIEVILDRSAGSIEEFLSRHAAKALTEEETITALKLLELQRFTMLMFTSCGWFFDDISRIETIQVLHYANRALCLAREIWGDSTEPHYLALLGEAQSNSAAYRDGRHLFEKLVKPATVDLKKVAAHYAVSALFESYGDCSSLFCYAVERYDYQVSEAGRARLALGRARFTSEIVRESAVLTFGVLHFGDHTINCGVNAFEGEEEYQIQVGEILKEFSQGNLPATIRMLDKHFGDSTYSLRSLFRDEKRKVLDHILRSTVSGTEALFRQVYENNAPLMRFLKDSSVPPPRFLQVAGELVLNRSLRRAFEEGELVPTTLGPLLDACRGLNISVEVDTLEFALRKRLEELTKRLSRDPENVALLQQLESALGLVPSLPFQVNLWKVQNLFFEVLQKAYSRFRENAEEGRGGAEEVVDHFRNISKSLSIRIDQ